MRFNIEIGYQIILGRLGDADDVVGCFSGFFKHDPIILPVEKRKILRKSQKNKIQHGDDARTGDFPGQHVARAVKNRIVAAIDEFDQFGEAPPGIADVPRQCIFGLNDSQAGMCRSFEMNAALWPEKGQ